MSSSGLTMKVKCLHCDSKHPKSPEAPALATSCLEAPFILYTHTPAVSMVRHRRKESSNLWNTIMWSNLGFFQIRLLIGQFGAIAVIFVSSNTLLAESIALCTQFFLHYIYNTIIITLSFGCNILEFHVPQILTVPTSTAVVSAACSHASCRLRLADNWKLCGCCMKLCSYIPSYIIQPTWNLLNHEGHKTAHLYTLSHRYNTRWKYSGNAFHSCFSNVPCLMIQRHVFMCLVHRKIDIYMRAGNMSTIP